MNESSVEFQEVYDAYVDEVYRFVRFMMGNSEDVYDIVQEVFLRAYRSWGQYRHDAGVKTWLFRIARNCASDFFRRKRTERNIMSTQELTDASASETPSFETLLVIDEALSKLKDTYRQVVVLRYIENFSVPDVAHILGCSETKVRTTAHRAIIKLRELLQDNFKEVSIQNETGQ